MSKSIMDPLERVFRRVQSSQMSRGAVLDHVPFPADRGGGLGTTTYGEWCYSIGMFQSLLFMHLPTRPVRMLDVGCGAGRLYLAAKPYLTPEDSYLGIDVSREFVGRCKRLYRGPGVDFLHVDASNGYYAADVAVEPKCWPIADRTYNLVSALSVWTHLREEDWCFYLREVSRVLSPGGRAIISFFVTDDLYRPERKTGNISPFYPQPQNKWIFDTPAYNSERWTYPHWAKVPEVAIAVDEQTFRREIADAGLTIERYLPGQWKDQPGFFFQDVAVLTKL